MKPKPDIAVQRAAGSELDVPGNLLSRFDGMVYRCLIDAHWTLHYVSDGCRALTGYAPADFIGNATLSFEQLIHPNDRARVRELILGALAAHQRFSVEYRIVRRDGIVRWVWEHGAGVQDAQGGYVALEGYVQDVTQRKQSEQALQEAERRFHSLFEHAVEGIFQSTPDAGYLTANPALARMYGYDSPGSMIATLRDIQHQLYVDPNRRAEFIALLNAHDAVVNFESQVYQRDGTVIWISENARVVRDAAGEVAFFEGTVVDITQRKLYEEKIRHQATHDALTGLPNRNLLYDRLEQALRGAQRSGGITAVAFIDLDQFKFINDSLGHHAGDELLKVVADRLRSCVRTSDTLARQGGDEFVLVLGDQKSCEAITDTIRRIISVVAEPWTVRGLDLQVTCSVGVSVYPADGRDAETLLRNADSAMYRAKELGRNNFQYFSAEMNLNATERLELLNSLRNAVAHEEFALHYQPKINLASGRLVGAEALIRWPSAARGIVAPGDFIPLAEESGLILPIGDWVLHSACRQAMAWQRAGHAPLPVAVNLSPRQLASDDIVRRVADVLAGTGLDPCWLELEITENHMMRDVDRSLQTLRKLKQLGVGISIDDFGTGYSSLNYLKRFPVDTLKIDRSFVSDIATDQDDAAIVKAVISLAHILNLKVVAEGVETAEQQRFLMENGCDEVQGYYFGRPLPAADFERICLARPAAPLHD